MSVCGSCWLRMQLWAGEEKNLASTIDQYVPGGGGGRGRGGAHNGINPFPPSPALFIFLEPAILFPLLACLSCGASLLNPLPYPQPRGLSLHISSPPQDKGLISGLLSWEGGSGFWIIYLISKYLFLLPTSSSSPVLGSLLY